MKFKIQLFWMAICIVGFLNLAKAQSSTCISANAGADVYQCAAQQRTLTASFGAIYETNSYAVSQIPYGSPGYLTSGGPDFNPSGGNIVPIVIDDQWTGSILLPFPFCFFGVDYNRVWVGSNGVISFNDPGTTFNSFAISGPASGSSPPDLVNCILGPWHDLDPSVSQAGQTKGLNMKEYGSAPCRAFVVSWYNIPMYGSQCNQDTSLNATHQIVLYETSNIVEIFIHNKDTCATWNNGQAIEGIQGDLSGNLTFFGVPGRNANSGPNYNRWAKHDDAWRFSPNGPAVPTTVSWYQGTNLIGTGNPLQVNPQNTTTYTAKVSYTSCGNVIVLQDDVTLHVGGSCVANNNSISLNTGMNIYNGTAGSIGSTDARWRVPQFPSQYYLTPWAAYLIDDRSGWAPPPPNTQWISAYHITNYEGPTPSPFIFQFCFCLCDSDSVIVDFELLADDRARVLLDGNPIAPTVQQYAFMDNNKLSVNMTTPILDPGQHCFTVEVWNDGGVAMGLNVVGQITSPRLLLDSCCAQPGTALGYTGLWATAAPLTPTFTPSVYAGGYAVACASATNGSVTVAGTGGNPPYSYLWNNGDTTASINGLPAGTYWVTVTDSTNQTATDSIVLTAPDSVEVTYQLANPTCIGWTNGAIDIAVSGGVPPFNYIWSNGATVEDPSNLTVGTYSVTLSDVNGCSAGASMTLNPGNVMDTLNLSTGRTFDTQDTLAFPNVDPNWAIVFEASSTAQMPRNAYVIEPHSDWGGTGWISNSAQSGASNRPGGTYIYRRLFTLAAVDVSTTLSLDFLADDEGYVVLNGDTVLTRISPGYVTPMHLVVSDTSFFNVGINVIEVHVSNINSTPHGFALSAILSNCNGATTLVGVEQNPLISSPLNGVRIHPNPTNDILHITGLPIHQKCGFSVIDPWGRTLIQSDSPDIDVKELAAGMYFLRLVSKQATQTMRFVKQ